jgi:hypothetical protein
MSRSQKDFGAMFWRLCMIYTTPSISFQIIKLFFLSYVIGDKSILKDAGIEDMKDVEALSPPPEIKNAQRSKGDVSYFICTKPGRGPVLLSDESQALLHPETGLPK